MKGTVLVSGANGFLGGHLLDALTQEGAAAVALVRHGTDGGAVRPGARKLFGSPVEPNHWVDAAKGVTCVVHSAAMVKHSRVDADEMVAFNVQSTKDMVRAAATLGARMVLVSTSGTVGAYDSPGMSAVEDSLYAEKVVSRWPYYASKVRAEKAAIKLAAELGVPLHIVRPPVMLGPQDPSGRSLKHVTRVLNGEVPFVPSGSIDFVDVRDAAQTIARLAIAGGAHGVYHLPGTSQSLHSFFQTVAEVAGTTFSRPQVPTPVMRGLTTLIDRVKPLQKLKLPDPVVLEMASTYWGASTLWSDRELGHSNRTSRQTISDAVAWARKTGTVGHSKAA